jgi:hypothetical protein
LEKEAENFAEEVGEHTLYGWKCQYAGLEMDQS